MGVLCLSLSSALGSPIRNLERNVVNMKLENEDLKRRLSAVTESMVDEIPQEAILNGTSLHFGTMRGVDAKAVMRRVGELLEKGRSVYVVAMEWPDKCNIVIGSSDGRVNAAELIKQASKVFNGKGGGDERVAMGSFPCDSYLRAFHDIAWRVKALLGS